MFFSSLLIYHFMNVHIFINPIYDSHLSSLVSKAGLSLDSGCVVAGLLVTRPLMWHSRERGCWPWKALKWHALGSPAASLGQCQTGRLFRWCRVRSGNQGQCGEVVCAHMCACVLGVRERDGHIESERDRDRKRRQAWRWWGRAAAVYDAPFISESSMSGPLCSPYFEGLIYFIKQW